MNSQPPNSDTIYILTKSINNNSINTLLFSEVSEILPDTNAKISDENLSTTTEKDKEKEKKQGNLL